MASIYVSYRSTEQPFVEAVATELEKRHVVHIDYRIPVGADWRTHQLNELRAAEVFLVFVSKDTAGSEFQNAEMGSARFASAFLDGKLIIPARLDNVAPPRPLADLDGLDLTHRNVAMAVGEIEQAIARRMQRVRLFISHAHLDADLAARLVDTIDAELVVPPGELRCTSLAGYQLDLGSMAPDVLRRELGSAACVVALLTPNSIANDWVLFELGATWANATMAIPLLAGGLQAKDIPGPFRGASGGSLNDRLALEQLLAQLARQLGWPRRAHPAAARRQDDLLGLAGKKSFARGTLDDELKASFLVKRNRIGGTQGQLLDHIAKHAKGDALVPIEAVKEAFPQRADSELFYRTEQLRLLGFLKRIDRAAAGQPPAWAWTLTDAYRQAIET